MTTSARAEEADSVAGLGKAASTLVLGLSGEAWDRVLVCALFVMAVAVVAAGLAASGSALSRRRDAMAAEQDRDRFTEAAEARIAAARADGLALGQAAGQEAGRAEGLAAGGAAAKAESERLSAENLRLRGIVERGAAEAEKAARPPPKRETKPIAARSDGGRATELSPERIAALTAALRSGPGNVSIDYDGVDARIQPLGAQLRRAFENAGWNVSSGIMLGIANPPRTGILIRANQAGATVQQESTTRAFKAAGIAFDLRLDRQPRPYSGGQAHIPFGMGPDDVEIFVTAPER